MQENRSRSEEEGMVAVSCPRWVQRKMLGNLCAAATDRLDPVRARKALAILAAIDRQANLPERQMKEEPVAYERRVEAVETAPEAVGTVTPRGQWFVEGLFRRCAAVLAGLRLTLQRGVCWIEQHFGKPSGTPGRIGEVPQS
jgi:hypothetical protein